MVILSIGYVCLSLFLAFMCIWGGAVRATIAFLLSALIWLIICLVCETYRVQAYEDRIVKRFLFRDILTLTYDEIDSHTYTITKLGTHYFDVLSSKGRIRMEIQSRNVEELLGWIDKKKKERQ